MTGLELLRALREISPDLPVAVITGHASVDYAVQAIRSDADEFLEKPVHPDELITTATMLVNKGRANRNAARDTVLAVGAHPDDVEIGAGGTLLVHKRRGGTVAILTLSHGARGGSRIAGADESRRAPRSSEPTCPRPARPGGGRGARAALTFPRLIRTWRPAAPRLSYRRAIMSSVRAARCAAPARGGHGERGHDAADPHVRLASRADSARREPAGAPGGVPGLAGRPGRRAPGRRRAGGRGHLRPGSATAGGRGPARPDARRVRRGGHPCGPHQRQPRLTRAPRVRVRAQRESRRPPAHQRRRHRPAR